MTQVPFADANGASIPKLGFGTWQLTGEDCVSAVRHALKIGYRHIDTAQIYANEAEVGRAIAESGVAREDIFLTTKVWMSRMAPGELEQSARESLEKLGVDQVDLLLLHWPNTKHPVAGMIGALNAAKAEGLTRHIGVSNYTAALLEEAVAASHAPLVTNQVEYHVLLDQTPVLTAARRHGLSVTAYSPIAQGKVSDVAVIREIARDHGKSPTQIALRWLMQQDGVIAIPRSSKPAHIEANFDIFGFELSSGQMDRLSALGSDEGRLIDPGWAPRWDSAR